MSPVIRPRVAPVGRPHQPLVPPGDDVCPVPAPVDEEPPHDRFCDLVMTGGVASGVVYPWAIVELARAYRFRNIGGTSVGAMAAALAAAAEYGRRTGVEAPFEVLRRLPAALGEPMPGGGTRMLSLFQALPQGRRLMRLWAKIYSGMPKGHYTEKPDPRAGSPGFWTILGKFIVAYAVPLLLGALLGWLSALGLNAWDGRCSRALMGVLTIAGALAGLFVALWWDFRSGVIANNLGLCKGGTVGPKNADDPRPGLVEWLHEGIQRSAGLKTSDAPLTFRDLWSAPSYPGAPATPCGEGDPDSQRAINLQMITTNVTHGRPYRLPLADTASRLFFRRCDLQDYLPEPVLDALVAAAKPYAPRPGSNSDPAADAKTEGFLELPGADMPIVVAARLSLSFPLLFSAVPLYAIDYERKKPSDRMLRRCLFTDGGVSSNFPIHIFDAALPRWPTFGLWLDKRGPYQDLDDDAPVWLPDFPLQGWGDNWNRFDPAADAAQDDGAEPCRQPRTSLSGILGGLLETAKDWHDRSSLRLPHVRNRVARLWLSPGEEGLHIGMSRCQILHMAHRYGTTAGKLFIERFCGENGVEKDAWREQRWIRLQILLSSLRERLTGLSGSAAYESHCLPIKDAIAAAQGPRPPLREHGRGCMLTAPQAASLKELLAELQRLESQLRGAVAQDYEPKPKPELRLRSPL